MNDPKQIAQAILDANKMHEESYRSEARNKVGRYTLELEECLTITCKKNDVSPDLWVPLALAMHWWNDLQLWAEDILAGRDI